MAFIDTIIGNIWAAWQSFGSLGAILWGLERLFPKSSVSPESQLRSLLYWIIAGIGTGIAVTLYGLAAEQLQPRPLVILPLNTWFSAFHIHWALYVVAPAISVILYDFFDYWMHRAQHKWFWNFHSVHHAIEELSGINSYFHWTEQLFRTAFIIIPAAYLVGIDAIKTAAIAELIVRVQGFYLHSPIGFHVGPVFRRIIADNRFHRIHHSVHPEHFDKNFGAGTSIWDQLFGTAYFPAEDEWPETGMREQPEASRLGEYLWGPFRRRNGDPASARGASTLSTATAAES